VAITKTNFFTDDARSQMDDFLFRLCAELQLNPTRHEQAVERYESVCRWLEGEGSSVGSFFPAIYPHGSMAIGTTVKPIGRDEYDLDFVCEFGISPSALQSPLQLLNLVEARLLEHEIYRSILERKKRCVRLNYAGEFHMDILPACADPDSSGGCVLVPDRQSSCWKPSNPKGFANWFEIRCSTVLAVVAEKGRTLGKAEPIPPQEAAEYKATLKRAVQLLKRWRDVWYQKQPELAPISMVVTTLAAQTYEGQLSVVDAISGILAKTISLIDTSGHRLYVLNPANPQEDLSEKWDDPRRYSAFVNGFHELNSCWNAILSTNGSGIHNASGLLETMFGEPVKTAIAKQAKSLQDLREKSRLRISPAGMITGASSRGVPMKVNTFHGW
jgi:hypothetical protein